MNTNENNSANSNVVPALMLDHVSKWYGNIVGLNDVSIAINGGVTGLLGMNGAGKSTLFKLIVGKLKPSQGTVRLFGIDPWKNKAPFSRIGYVPEHEKLYDWMTAFEFVTIIARLFGHSRDSSEERAKHVLKFVGLEDVMHKELGKYSKGMRQRAKIAQALVNDPDLIILDEPLAGLDKNTISKVIEMILQETTDKTLIVITHDNAILPHLDKVVDINSL